MLQQVREQTQGVGFKIIVGILVVVLAVFGFGGFNLFAPTDPVVASINGSDISRGELEVEARRQLQQLAAQFGEEFDPSLIDPSSLEGQALNRLITQELLSQTASELQVGIADGAVSETLNSNGNFQIDGRFDEQTYRRVVSQIGYSPQGFLEVLRRDLTLDRLSTAFTASSILPRWELEQAARFLAQTRTIAQLDFTADTVGADASVDDAAVRTYFDENQSAYMTEFAADASYLQLSWQDLVDDPSISVTDADLEARFESELEAFADTAEQRDSSHILLRVTDDRDDEATRAALQALREEIEGGADFAELAQASSEDPGSKLQGGSLGPVGKNIFDPAFEDALFAMTEVGELAGPVKSAFGWHLIRLDGIESRPLPTLDERRDELTAALREEAAQALFDERRRELDELAFENPDSLEPLAQALGLAVQTASRVAEGRGTGPFADPALREALFASDVLDEGLNSPAVELADGTAVVVRSTAQYDPEARPFEEVSEQIRAQLLAERSEALVIEAHADALARLQDGEAVQAVADSFGLEWTVTAAVKQTDRSQLDPAILRAAFLAEAPAPGDKTIVEADLAGGGRTVLSVSDVVEGDIDALSEAETANLQRVVQDRTERLDFLSLYRTVEDDAAIKRPSALGGSS